MAVNWTMCKGFRKFKRKGMHPFSTGFCTSTLCSVSGACQGALNAGTCLCFLKNVNLENIKAASFFFTIWDNYVRHLHNVLIYNKSVEKRGHARITLGGGNNGAARGQGEKVLDAVFRSAQN